MLPVSVLALAIADAVIAIFKLETDWFFFAFERSGIEASESGMWAIPRFEKGVGLEEGAGIGEEKPKGPEFFCRARRSFKPAKLLKISVGTGWVLLIGDVQSMIRYDNNDNIQ